MFFRGVLDAFGSRARIVLVQKDRTPVGSLMTLVFKDTVVVPWASCRREYFALCPNMLMYWAAIRTACRDGYRRFDFGRSTRGSGTYRFKRQWGVEEAPLYWYTVSIGRQQATTSVLRDSAESAMADLAMKTWQRLPLRATRVLGPHVRKYLIQ